ncbi:unnamed protein product [Didymodactylos carnosus]|nr:unnamed protein product [Didymodactylos carnosus]CAF4159053.1 unnamed protein product [Didymodactylos carnosus]
MGHRHCKYRVEYVQDPATVAAIQAQEQANAQLRAEYEKVQQLLEAQKLDSFEKLKAYDQRAADALVQLATQTQAISMEGKNIALFGITSAGKSTIVNKILNKEVAAVGVGETTKEVTPYDGNGYRFYDVPGKNDDLSYFTMQYIGFWKGLTHRLVVVTTTLKEMTKVFSLLGAMGLHCDIIVNKFDLIEDVNEAEKFKQQILQEVQECEEVQNIDNIFFVSATNPDQFPDWAKMVQYLTAQ